MAVISILFVLISVIYYEQVISQALFLRPSFKKMEEYIGVLFVSNDEKEIKEYMSKVNILESELLESVKAMSNAFLLIQVLCFFNLMYFFS
jgi:hypothetical protein